MPDLLAELGDSADFGCYGQSGCTASTHHDDCAEWREVNDPDDPDFMPRTSPYVKPSKRTAAPAVTRDDLAKLLRSRMPAIAGTESLDRLAIHLWDEFADALLVDVAVYLRPTEGSDTDGHS